MRWPIGLLFLLAAHRAHAQTGGVELAWEAPQGCPASAEVEKDIAALLGGATSNHVRAEGRVAREADGAWVLDLVTTTGGASRRREMRAATCVELASATATVLSLEAGGAREREVEGSAPVASGGVGHDARDVAPSTGALRPSGSPTGFPFALGVDAVASEGVIGGPRARRSAPRGVAPATRTGGAHRLLFSPLSHRQGGAERGWDAPSSVRRHRALSSATRAPPRSAEKTPLLVPAGLRRTSFARVTMERARGRVHAPATASPASARACAVVQGEVSTVPTNLRCVPSPHAGQGSAPADKCEISFECVAPSGVDARAAARCPMGKCAGQEVACTTGPAHDLRCVPDPCAGLGSDPVGHCILEGDCP